MKKVFIFLVLAVILIACTGFVNNQQSDKRVATVAKVSSTDDYRHYVEKVGDHYHHIYVSDINLNSATKAIFVVIDNQK